MSDSDRIITQWDGFKSPPDDDTLLVDMPSDPPLPSGVTIDLTERAPALAPIDPLVDMIDRLATLSDAVLSPEGLLHRLFGALEQRANERHQETMRALTATNHTLATVADNQVEMLARLNRLEPTVEEHEARLRLVHSNGHDHGHAIDP